MSLARTKPNEVAEVFTALIIDGLLEGDLDPRRAFQLGRKAGHYGLIALADQDEVDRGWLTVRSIVGRL